MDKIILKNILVRGILGINPEERTTKQNIILNVTLFTDIRQAAASKNIEDAVNYYEVTERLITFVENASFLLLETLTTEVAKLVLTENPAVARVRVCVEKPTILRYADSVGIEIERSREDL